MVTVFEAIDTVYKQMVAILLENLETEVHWQVAAWPHAHGMSDTLK